VAGSSRSESDARDDASERRRRLRALDLRLAEEIDDAGALTFTELRLQVRERGLLPGSPSDATLWEWWGYACRRRVIETDDGRLFRLSPDARSDVAARVDGAALRIMPTIGRFSRSATPAGWLSIVISLAALALSAPSVGAVVIGVVLAIALFAVVGFLADVIVIRRVDLRLNRWILMRQIAWLDGRFVPGFLWRRPQDPVRIEAAHRVPGPPGLAGAPLSEAAAAS
jgi:hypothetical protein